MQLSLAPAVEKAADYLPALRDALEHDETTVLDVITDPSAYPPITFFAGLDGIRDDREKRRDV